MIRNAFRFSLVAALALSAGCTEGGKSPTQAAEPTAAKKGGAVIARFGDQTLTADELSAKLDERSPFERASYLSLEKKKQFVEQLVRFEVLADEAKRRGLDKDPEVVHAMQTVMVRKLVQQEIDENPARRKMDDAELQAYYDAHKTDYVHPERLRLSAIILRADSKAAAEKRVGEASALVKQLRAKPNDYAAFSAMVSQKSEDPATKALQGDLRFLSQDELTQRYGPELAAAAFKLNQQGEVSDPIATDKGVFVIKLTGRMPGLNESFEQAKPTLTQRAWFEKRGKVFDGFVDDLEKKANYTLDTAALEAFKVDPTAPTRFAASAPGVQPVQASAKLPPPGEKGSH